MTPSSTNCCAKGACAATSPLPDPAPDAGDPPNKAAFVAVHTGFEIQIDEEARGDRRFGEPDGSFFARTGAIYKITSPGTGQGQQDYKNNQNLAAERWHSYEIEVNNQGYIEIGRASCREREEIAVGSV